ncbi:MAG: acetyl-CoA carboxylase biotin carboxyl carrier protein subunit [Stomatobaculum sp.]|nr:acetyl-CoA carboxylase biotin carboxyl carrier protein subunit [Stomatobaculum sp.]
MKNYTITVNGQTYVVQVEEGITAGAQAAPVVTIPQAPVYAAPAPAPAAAPAPAPAPAPAAPAGAAGGITVESPMPGKILSIEKNVGDTVEAGAVIIILEAMKMENEIVAPEGGTIASMNVTVGQAVEAGEVLATLN